MGELAGKELDFILCMLEIDFKNVREEAEGGCGNCCSCIHER